MSARQLPALLLVLWSIPTLAQERSASQICTEIENTPACVQAIELKYPNQVYSSVYLHTDSYLSFHEKQNHCAVGIKKFRSGYSWIEFKDDKMYGSERSDDDGKRHTYDCESEKSLCQQVIPFIQNRIDSAKNNIIANLINAGINTKSNIENEKDNWKKEKELADLEKNLKGLKEDDTVFTCYMTFIDKFESEMNKPLAQQ